MKTVNWLGHCISLLTGVALGIVALPFSANVAFAQADAGADANEEVEEIIVTGSRIRRAGFDTLQPAVQIDADFLETRGFINIADALNEVPTFGPPGSGPVGQGTGTAVGQNFVNAFSLGSQRTLVLINGRRVVSQNSPGTGGITSGQQVDLNIIPTALIERVETIFNGGAPIYGADAVAATVNIILKQDFEGAQFDAQYGISDEGDADNYLFRTLIGGNFDSGRGNAVVAFEYARQDGILPAERSIGRRDINFQDNPDPNGPNLIINDNSEMVWQVPLTGVPLQDPGFWTVPFGDGANGFVDASGNGLIFEVDGQSLISATPDIIGTPSNSVFGTDPGGFDNPYVIALGRTNTLLTPSERWATSANGHYDITDRVQVFSEFLFSRSESVDHVNQPPWGGGFFAPGASSAIKVPLTNPYVTAGVANTIQTQLEARDLNGDGMPDGNANLLDMDGDGVADTPGFFLTRQNGDIVGNNPNFRDQNVFRIVTGLKGDVDLLNRSWEWELSYNFGQTDADTRVTTLNPTRYPLALDAVLDTDGNIVCRSTRDGEVQPGGNVLSQPTIIDDVIKCLPINPMGFGNFSPEVVDYLVQERFRKTTIRQQIYELTASGDLFDLPSGTVQIAGGITHRKEEAGFFSDLASETGQEPLFEQAVLTTQGEYDTNEYYVEASIPLLENGSRWDLPGIASFRLDGAIRYVDNSVAGSDNTWTVGARLRFDLPWFEDGLMIRGNVTQAIRSPSITEFFLPESPSTDRGADPCDEEFVDTGINPAVRRSNCQEELDAAKAAAPPTAPIQSVTLDTFMSTVVNASAPGVVSGSTTLSNEVSDSWTVGIVLTPPRISGLRLSADWTVIEIDQAIENVSLDTIFAACYDDPSSPVEACGRLQRNPDSFQLARYRGGFLNAAVRDFEGLVVNLDYRTDATDLPLMSNVAGEFWIAGSYFHTNLQAIAITGVTPQDNTGERGFEQNLWQLNLGYQRQRLGFLWQVRWLGEGNANNSGGADQAFPLKYDELVINNFTTTFELSDMIDLRFVVNNVFDEFPSDARIAYSGDTSVTSGGNANFFDDPVGRRFLFGISVKF